MALERARELGDGVVLLPLRTPTLPPATSTNTLVLGSEQLLVIEPATPFADEQAQLVEHLERRVAAGSKVKGVAITHHHVDHIGFVVALARRFAVPIFAHAETAARVPFAVDVVLAHDDTIELDPGRVVVAWHTPGHAPGHLVFFDHASGIAHVGDLVAGEGTILIDPADDGDMAIYLASLASMIERARADVLTLVPAHGPVITDALACLRHYVEHRLAREAKLLSALDACPLDFTSLLGRTYDDVPVHLHAIASGSLEAHVRKLEREGRVIRRDGTITRIDAGQRDPA